ncbi:hypothetical protein AGDE_05241 [Angomonas deanei]|nr:hypothetical protein AGDE_05241 [Angomonas deanei]|eukprot:EPY38688.1 hypothetical protein AGDE_05241 [Angomonas deanei]
MKIRGENERVLGTGDGEREYQMAKETEFMRSLNASRGPQRTTDGGEEGEVDSYGYKIPSIPPVGRVEERKRLMTTKNVTVDATGEYLQHNLEPYPSRAAR